MERHGSNKFDRSYYSKIFRMKSILKNDGKTSVSEGIDANFQDILNYSVFAQILLKE